jgi:hypothetical protein
MDGTLYRYLPSDEYLKYKNIIIYLTTPGSLPIRFLHWDNTIKAPISFLTNFKTFDDLKDYLNYWDLIKKVEGGMATFNDSCRALFSTEKEMLIRDIIIKDNSAGINGECISWEQILELYK